MKKAPLYSRSRRPADQPPQAPAAPSQADAVAPAPPGRWARLKAGLARRERWWWAGALLVVLGVALGLRPPAGKAPLTIEQIDHLMRQSIAEKPLDSAEAKAYQKVLPSVVRVVGYLDAEDEESAGKPEAREAKPDARADPKSPGKVEPGGKEGKHGERGVGTGVVIVDNGTILTNLHVVLGAQRIKVTFFDGLEAEARIVSVMPEHDLAVLRAQKIPDDLFAATMRSTADLAPGDHVMAVGFPFGIGPSASSGVVSGLKREFRSPEGERVLTNLIQFDAAANPGNSGGPLVTMEGEVVGIVTAILNPTKQRVFVGIGFAVPIENAAAGAGMPPF
jgi:S1-C subfamily serine protease